MTLLYSLLDAVNPAEEIEIVANNISLGFHTKAIWGEKLTKEAKRSEVKDFYSDYDRDAKKCGIVITIKPLSENLIKEART